MVKTETTPLVAVLLGYASTPAKAAQIVDTYHRCPYCVSYRGSGRMVTGVFSIPPEHRWWLEWVADAPEETLGLEYAAIFYPQAVEAFSPWARGEVKSDRDQAPCQADCRECPRYGEDCKGCPATLYYMRGKPRAELGDGSMAYRAPTETA
jgi:hypothetical protein